MTDRNELQPDLHPQVSEPASYEPPRIERVLTPEEMEREVMFAGPGVPSGDL